MSDTTELEERLRATLRAKSAQVLVDDGPFDASHGADVVPLAGHRRRGRSVWLLAAAVAAVVALAVGVTVVRAGHRQATVSQSDHPDRPGVFAPTWMPDGYQLWDVSPSSGAGSEVPGSGPVTIQLFADDRAPMLAVQVGATAGPNPDYPAPLGEAATVRGVAGHVRTTTVTTSADQAPVERLEIRWEEDGQPVVATIDHTDQARALDMLGAMAWQTPGDPFSGVAPGSLSLVPTYPLDLTGHPGSNPLRLVGGVVNQAVPTAAVTTFVYAEGTPTLASASEITVRVGGPGSGLVQYYESQLGSASLQADGTLETTSAVPAIDTQVGSVMWPDGRAVIAIAAGVDAGDLLRIARSAAPTDDADLDARRAEITARVLTLPVVATADISPLTLEVHGDGGTALCAHAGSGPVTCGAVAGVNGGSFGGSGSAGLTVSVVVDGDWYIGAVGTLPFSYTPVSHEFFAPGDTTSSSTPDVTTLADLPVVHTVDQAPWHFLVAAMPPAFSDASVEWDTTTQPSCRSGGNGGSCATGVSVTRPTS